jgi:hypothetical protein
LKALQGISIVYKGIIIWITIDFPLETMVTKRQWNSICEILLYYQQSVGCWEGVDEMLMKGYQILVKQ